MWGINLGSKPNFLADRTQYSRAYATVLRLSVIITLHYIT